MVITVENDGTVVIKAPKWTQKATIERFYRANLLWIASKRINLKQNSDKITVLTEEDVKKLKQQAKAVMLQKTEHYSKIMGLKEEVRGKFRGTLSRIVNEGATGLVCLIV